jgi:hypothetical protein
VVAGSLDLSQIISGVRPYVCSVPGAASVPKITDVKGILTGLRIDTSGPMSHRNVFVEFSVLNYNSSTYVVDWAAIVNWQDQANTMVDSFDVVVDGRLLWTATSDIRMVEIPLNCTSTGSNCTTSSGLTTGRREVLGGVAFNRIGIEAYAAASGMSTDLLEAHTYETGVAPNYTIYADSTIGGAAGIALTSQVVAIFGQSGAVIPFQITGSLTSATNSAPGFSVGTGPFSHMNCGVRKFTARDSSAIARKYKSLWFGQKTRECGWTPSNLYIGSHLFGWERFTGNFDVDNTSDATRMP